MHAISSFSLASARLLRSLFLFAALLGGMAAFTQAEPKAASSASPERVIRDFYQWYVGAVVANRDPFEGGRAELKRYATARLLREIDGMRKGPDGLDGDYFLDAQDFDKEWGKNITIATPVVKGDKATAEVELKSAAMGSRKLRVSLAQEGGAWKVDKVQGR